MQSVLDSLKSRDAVEQQMLPYFRAFAVAADRADSSRSQAGGAGDSELAQRLAKSRDELREELERTQLQLEQMYEKNRDLNEEKYLKTHTVQNLYDEILALNMQLNLSEEKRKRLQDELGR